MNREFPQSPDAEKGVLSSLLLAPNEARYICAERGLSASHFYLPAHDTLFAAMVDILDSGAALDFITLAQRLQDNRQLDSTGGPGYLNELFTMLPSAANVAQYVDTVIDKALLRSLIQITTDASNNAFAPCGSSQELIATVHGKIGALIHNKSKRQTVRECLQEIIDEVREGKNDTGLLDFKIEGIGDRLRLYRGDLFIISAPTSCGKTALGAQFAFAAAMAGHRIALYPLEMRQNRS